MAYLALVRHGESEWNAKNLFTGWADRVLTRKGFLQARESAEKLKGIKWDLIFESDLERVKESAEITVKTLNLKIPVIETSALRERNYGIYTQKDKDFVKKELGPDFEKFHRGWDFPIPEGESLKQVYERVVPYYLSEIEPRLKSGLNIIVFASGNSLRALCKYIKNLSDQEIENFEIKTGEVLLTDYT
ncbi:histidine phosphatase family protein [Candidatus Microgenomates bacterium]|nr:histidine phosphatase family protein [Candidatus Microgenomates bacterium]